MKLTKGKLEWLIRQKRKGASSCALARALRVSRQRIDQLWYAYRCTGQVPVLGRQIGRPRSILTTPEVRAILNAKERYRFGARMLEPIIRQRYGLHIPHNRIHRILREHGLAQPNERRQARRRWVRYEREHSCSAVHMDWHEGQFGQVCTVLDDASRKIMAAGEYPDATAHHTITLLDAAQRHARRWGTHIREVITDHGCQFTANKLDKHGRAETQFGAYLDANGIKHIKARVKHPQTNGKQEKWFHLYEQHRAAFPSLDAFVRWYNEVRPHSSLDFSRLETPHQAFVRKLPQ